MDRYLIVTVPDAEWEDLAELVQANPGCPGVLEVGGHNVGCRVSVMRVLPVSADLDGRMAEVLAAKSAAVAEFDRMWLTVACPACWPHDGGDCSCVVCQHTGLLTAGAAADWIRATPSCGFDPDQWPHLDPRGDG